MKTMTTSKRLKLRKTNQTDGAILMCMQGSRFDHETSPNFLLAGVEQLVAVVFLDIGPLGGVLFSGRLNSVEPILASHESYSSGSDPVGLVAVGTGERLIHQLDLSEILSANDSMRRSAGAIAFDVGPV